MATKAALPGSVAPAAADIQSIACAVLAAALFGTALVTTHAGLRYMDALSGARVSIPVATLLFWLLAPLRDLSGWQSEAAVMFAVVGVFFPAAVTLLTFAANQRLGPAVAGTIGGTAPLFAVLGAALFLDEPLGIREAIATGVIVLGCTLLSSPDGTVGDGRTRGALWLPWTSAVLRGAAQVLSKAGLALWPNPFAAALMGYSVSAAAVWGAPLLSRQRPGFVANRHGVAWFAATGALNGGAVLAMYYALGTGPVYLVSPIVATYPLFTLALSALVLRLPMRPALLVGVALTVAGVALLLARW
jgi:drug/metabolite transporter (DMT)-like permease